MNNTNSYHSCNSKDLEDTSQELKTKVKFFIIKWNISFLTLFSIFISFLDILNRFDYSAWYFKPNLKRT